MTSEEIVQQQVEAYNERNIVKFLACHASDIELYTFPESEPYCVGKASLKEIYQSVFENSPNLNAAILNRIIMGNIVIDHENVTGRKGIASIKIIAIYEIKNGLISKARFIREK